MIDVYFFDELSFGTNETIEPISVSPDGTYEINTSSFALQCCVRNGIFYIEWIESFIKGFGRRVVEVIKQFAEECGLLVIAQQFLDAAAEEFWQDVGFVWSDYYKEYVFYAAT